MQPRLVSSKKWTQFPVSFREQIHQVFHDAFKEPLANGKLVIEGRIYPEEILLRVGYLENGRLVQNNFEISVAYSALEKDTIDRIHNCIDAAASMLQEFFAAEENEEEVEFPRTWKNYEFSGREIWVQYTTVNTNLEAEADRLLGLDEPALVAEESDNDDALARAEDKLKGLDLAPDFYEEDDGDEDAVPKAKAKPAKNTKLH